MKKLLVVLAVLMAAAVGLSNMAPPSQQEQFEKALAMEEVQGKLQDAITLYQKIVDESGDQVLAAKALLQMGKCYEKLGRDEASKTYQRILDEYSQQLQEVKLARERLAALRKPTADDSGPVTRRVWAGPKTDFFGSVSPDGKYISFVDWETGDLAVRDLEKGINRRLTNKGSWESSGEEAEKAIWSPDSKQIAYLWWTLEGYEIRLIDIDDPTPRIFYRCKNDQEYIEPYDWSSDGRYILAILNRDGGKQIVLMSVTDAVVRTLKTLLPGPGLSRAVISPDGQYVVYDYVQNEYSLTHDIFLISIKVGNEIPLVEYPTDDVVLGWSPDGKWLMFLSNRRGSIDAWAIKTEDGKPMGDPVILKSAVGPITPLGITRNGSLFFGVAGGSQDVYLAKLDSETGNILGSPTKFIKNFEGFNRSPQYSPDGKYLAYISKKAGMLSSMEPRRWGYYLYVRSLETGGDKEYQRELMQLGLTRVDFPRWSPDGRSLLLYGRDRKGLYGIYHINLETGKTVCVLQGKEQYNGPIAVGWLDDNNFLCMHDTQIPSCIGICVRNLENGSEKILLKASTDRVMAAVSPDRRWVSVLENYPADKYTLQILSADSGEVKQLIELNQTEGPIWMRYTWSADSKYIFYSRRVGTQSNKWQVWRISIDGGQPQKTGLEMPGSINEISAHPDGKHLVFQGTDPESAAPAEVWVMENFLTQ